MDGLEDRSAVPQPVDAWTGEVPVAPPDGAGGVEVGEFLIRAAEYAWNTGDTGLLGQAGTDRCEVCEDVGRRIEELYGAGGWGDQVRYEGLAVHSHGPHPDDAAVEVVVATFTSGARSMYAPGSAPREAEPRAQAVEAHICGSGEGSARRVCWMTAIGEELG